MKKIYDLVYGILFSLYLVKKHRIDYVFSEGFPGAVIGNYIAVFSGKKHVVHTFEPHADYMMEANVWSRNSWEYIFLKKQETYVAKKAYKLITATEAYKREYFKNAVHQHKFVVLPSCVDSEIYKFDTNKRDQIRKKHGLKNDVLVLCYLGKLGGMYMDEELFKFIAACKDRYPEKFYFMIFNSSPSEEVNSYLQQYEIPENKVLHKYLSKNEVSGYLSAADFGIVAVKPFPSKRFCSPIKNGEYLSCGLPLLTPDNIGDDSEEVKDNEKLGLILTEPFDELADKITKFYCTHTRTQIANYCRNYAVVTRDLSKGLKVFNDILSA